MHMINQQDTGKLMEYQLPTQEHLCGIGENTGS